MHRRRVMVPVVLLMAACTNATTQTGVTAGPRVLPQTMGERTSGFGYVPLDGLAVHESYDYETCFNDSSYTFNPETHRKRPLLSSLPDISVRFAVASLDAEGGVSFGPAKVTAKGRTYRAVLDYVNVDALPVEFYMRKFVRTEDALEPRSIYSALNPGEDVASYDVRVREFRYTPTDSATHQRRVTDEMFDQVTVPVYVGIGMRLTADIRALKGGITLASLAAIAAEAQANALSGTLTVQTLGIAGRGIATALPLPSKLDQTTVENGILALGSSRALIYSDSEDDAETTKTVRVVGLYSPVGTDPRLINVIYSELSRTPPPWKRLCSTTRSTAAP